KVKDTKIILARAEFDDTTENITRYNTFIIKYYSPSITMHGVFMELYGYGVFISGKSGIGKSETALELVHRGHRLVADDIVKFGKNANGDIFGCSANLPYFMEIRGLGIIDIKSLYGLGAVRINKRLDVVVELIDPEDENYSGIIYYENSTAEILGNKIGKVTLSITSGRNAAAMVEIAVMNLMAKRLGHDAQKLYNKGIECLTDEEKKLLRVDENEES
ncbi:MAG: serine kinase, partial [Fusobacteriaceae bacterium]